MAGTHGDLFREIGALVMTAHQGQAFDLKQTADELARCYGNLGVSSATIARAITRSMAAVGVSMELFRGSSTASDAEGDAHKDGFDEQEEVDAYVQGGTRSASVLLPSGVRLAVLS